MSNATYTDTARAGALVRRHVRVLFDFMGVEWTEHKGLLDSAFVVTATPSQFRQINAWFDEAES